MMELEEIVEIDENERYWVGKGFGKGGFLPNDRGAFSTPDGSRSWKSMKDVCEDLTLLGRGWVYSQAEDEFIPTHKDRPGNGWMYAADFRPESLNQAKPTQGSMHFVRFRRLMRVKNFKPEEFVSKDIFEKCDHCDSSAITAISKQILDVVTYCSLLHSITVAPEYHVLTLKEKLITLAMTHEVEAGQDPDIFYQLDLLRRRLENHIEVERSQTIMSRLISGVDFTFYSRTGRKGFIDRRNEVTARCLPERECDAIASLIVRKLDSSYQVHCDKVACGENCKYIHVRCPNKGCSDIMSQMLLESHAPQCPHRLVRCECGDELKGMELNKHRSQACKLRIVPCPFIGIGCIRELRACDVQDHLNDDSHSHLLLGVNRIIEQQETIKNLQLKVAALEVENKELTNSLNTQMEVTTRDLSELKLKLSKTEETLGDLDSTCQKEFKRSKNLRFSLT